MAESSKMAVDFEETDLLQVLIPENKEEFTLVNMGEEDTEINTDAINKEKKRKNNVKKTFEKSSKAVNKSSKKPLHYAAEAGDEQKVQKLVMEHPEDVHLPDERGQTPLHLAAKGMHLRCCQILLEASKNEVVYQDKSGNTPLLLSISSGIISFDTTKLILYNSEKVTFANNARRTALHIAADKGNLNTLNLLLEQDQINLDAVDAEQTTPLHLASKNGHFKICMALLHAGANKEAKDVQGFTALHWAAKMGFNNCIKELVSSGCKVDCTNKDLNTPLHLFCISKKQRPLCAQILLSNGANPNVQNKNGKTPFHVVQFSPFEVKETFTDYSIDLQIADNEGKTALHYAAERRKESKHVDFILTMEEMKQTDQNGFINTKDDKDNTALHIAVKIGELESCKSLVRAGADGNICSAEGTALHLAAEKGFKEICEYLIAKGIKVDIKNKELQTPLHMAAKNGHSECCEILIRKGGKGISTDAENNTALHYAAEGGHASCIKVIIDMQRNLINRCNNFGKTPLHIALEQKCTGGCEVLEQNSLEVKSQEENSLEHKSLVCCEALITTKTNLWATSDEIYVPSPILLAYKSGYFHIFDHLLKSCSITKIPDRKKDIDFQKLMKVTLRNSNRQVVKSIIESIYWEEALQPSYGSGKNVFTETKDGKNLDNPDSETSAETKNINLKHLVEKYPELAEIIFQKCLPAPNDSKENNYYIVQYIDEICKQKEYTENKTESEDPLLPTSHRSPSQVFDPDSGKLLPDVKTDTINHIWRKQHVLSSVTRQGHRGLLTHPLVTRWIDYKWRTYVRFGYYASVGWTLLHAVLLTTFSLLAWDWREMYMEYQLNQTAVCSMNKKIVGPEVVVLLRKEARVPNNISYVIYAMMSLWILHHIYKIIKLRTVKLENFLLLVCLVTNVLLLVNFTECSQITYVREDWQWVAGPLSLVFAWILVYYTISHHLYFKPLLFNMRMFLTAARDILLPLAPVIIIGIVFNQITQKGSLTLITGMNWLFVTFREMPSAGSMVVLVIVVIVLLAQFRNSQRNKKRHYDEKSAIHAINMILDFDVLYPFLMRGFYLARIPVNKTKTRGPKGPWSAIRNYLPFTQSKQGAHKTDYNQRKMGKQEVDDLLREAKINIAKSLDLIAKLHND